LVTTSMPHALKFRTDLENICTRREYWNSGIFAWDALLFWRNKSICDRTQTTSRCCGSVRLAWSDCCQSYSLISYHYLLRPFINTALPYLDTSLLSMKFEECLRAKLYF